MRITIKFKCLAIIKCISSKLIFISISTNSIWINFNQFDILNIKTNKTTFIFKSINFFLLVFAISSVKFLQLTLQIYNILALETLLTILNLQHIMISLIIITNSPISQKIMFITGTIFKICLVIIFFMLLFLYICFYL